MLPSVDGRGMVWGAALVIDLFLLLAFLSFVRGGEEDQPPADGGVCQTDPVPAE